ncbi:hypothetical protein NC651_024745 [Populus alba x Populus x berolinensis]|nr:hypothetical protein NC651_024745 [Populus alba x Populus x berolinensis]
MISMLQSFFQHSFSHLADDWSIQKIGGLTWDAFSFIMKTAHAYRGNGETSKKIPGQHRERVVSATNSRSIIRHSCLDGRASCSVGVVMTNKYPTTRWHPSSYFGL